MHPRIMAERNALARARTAETAHALGEKYGLSEQVTALDNAKYKDPEVEALLEREAVADLLESIAQKLGVVEKEAAPPPPPPPVSEEETEQAASKKAKQK